MKRILVIPARLESRRLPNKPLLEVAGKPLIQWTWELACQVEVDQVLVASPDEALLHAVEQFGARGVLTDATHPNGTLRTAQAVSEVGAGNDAIIMNLQADEPLAQAADLLRMFKFLESERRPVVTLVSHFQQTAEDFEKLVDPNQTKVAYSGIRCHWFSRSPMAGAYAHIGVYCFTHPALRWIGSMTPTRLSREESLEQLTWLENDVPIYALEAPEIPLGINTQFDLEQLRCLKESLTGA